MPRHKEAKRNRTQGFPATETRLIQYLFPLESGRLWPNWRISR